MAAAACGEPSKGTPAADGHQGADAGGEPTQGTPAADELLVADIGGEPTNGTPAADERPSADAGGEPTNGTPAAVVLATTDPPTAALSAPNVFSRFLRVVAGFRPVFRA